jgi:hypothetical protein
VWRKKIFEKNDKSILFDGPFLINAVQKISNFKTFNKASIFSQLIKLHAKMNFEIIGIILDQIEIRMSLFWKKINFQKMVLKNGKFFRKIL